MNGYARNGADQSRMSRQPPGVRGQQPNLQNAARQPRPAEAQYLSSQRLQRAGASTRSAALLLSSSSPLIPRMECHPHTAAARTHTDQTRGRAHPLYHYTVTGPHGIVLHDFVGQQADELSFTTGDVIEILEKVDDDWMKGKNVNKTGIFPKSYIRVVIPLPQKAAPRAAAQHHGVVTGPRCRARFDFDAEQDDELAFSEGATIALRERVSNDWLRGELAGRTGIFPSVYVEIVEDLPREVMQRSCAGRVATAMYDFDGRENELTFKQGDEVTLVSKVNDDWLVGHFHGNEGRFPAAFVDHVPIDLPLEDAVTVATKAAAPASKHAVALYSFDAGSPSELSLRSGDKVVITGSVNEDWLIGRVNGKEGSFPASFVEIKADQPVKFRVRSASETPPFRSSGTARAVYAHSVHPYQMQGPT
ncbi:PREDICTED: SH3 domain-containing protein 19-like [Priapulus caudatus]|uniref:SH3 domain-containing protein 19-like n=1 Tax=Priapulus caudatus TaxID=37621 RepID=A0ABM1ELL1_PRICU|nr:PREDICTED: SH3 domain-containing protein 19-like [Priapulus caudatus]